MKVSFVTGSRADYGIVRDYLNLLKNNKDIELTILVTGALLCKEYGHQVDLIREDGFNIGAEIDIEVDPSSIECTTHSMALALDKFGKHFAIRRPDLLIALGDRYEILSVALAAAMNRIPILHMHGGEATFGNYDEFIRHAITKMSLFHFASTERYRERIIQLGENPDRVFNVGALGAINCLKIDDSKVLSEVKELKPKSYFVVLFHPETLSEISVYDQTTELLKAIAAFKDNYMFVFIGSNADTHSDTLRKMIAGFVSENDNCMYFESLTTSGYHYLLKNSLGLIGNSSSGIIEAPSLGIFTVNIGKRQEGRERGNSIIDVQCERNEIIKAIDRLANDTGCVSIINPYFNDMALELYYEKTLEILERIKKGETKIPKTFFDINMKVV